MFWHICTFFEIRIFVLYEPIFKSNFFIFWTQFCKCEPFLKTKETEKTNGNNEKEIVMKGLIQQWASPAAHWSRRKKKCTSIRMFWLVSVVLLRQRGLEFDSRSMPPANYCSLTPIDFFYLFFFFFKVEHLLHSCRPRTVWQCIILSFLTDE